NINTEHNINTENNINSKDLIINDNLLKIVLKYELNLKPDMFGPGLNNKIQDELENKYLNKAHGIFYIKNIHTDISKLQYPLIYLNDGKYKLLLDLETTVYLVNINDILELTIYVNDNEIYGEN